MGYREIPVATEACLGCKQTVDEGTAICPGCGSPIDIAQFAELELRLKPYLRQARGALGVATVIFGLGLWVLAAIGASSSSMGVASAAVGTVLFGGCFLISARRPLLASALALSVFTALQMAVVVRGDFWLLFQSSFALALKVILVVLLAGSVQAGLRIRDIRRQSRPRDRRLALAAVALTTVAGLALGLWERAERMQPWQDQAPQAADSQDE
jgi:hypothetical protein